MNLDNHELARRAEQVYEQRLMAQLEVTNLNAFVAIDPDTGDFCLENTLSVAAQAFRKTHPGRQGFVMRVGHRAALFIGAWIT